MSSENKKAAVAGQRRHGLNTIGGLIAGAGLANTDVVQSIIVLMEQWGVDPNIQALIGLVVLGVAHVMSYMDKMKKENKDV